MTRQYFANYRHDDSYHGFIMQLRVRMLMREELRVYTHKNTGMILYANTPSKSTYRKLGFIYGLQTVANAAYINAVL